MSDRFLVVTETTSEYAAVDDMSPCVVGVSPGEVNPSFLIRRFIRFTGSPSFMA